MAEHQTPRRGMRGGPGAFVPGEKAKNFGGTIRKLLRYIGSYRAAVCLVALFAVGSTLFNIAGPKVLGSATTRLAAGLQSKIAGTGAIDFPAIARILLAVSDQRRPGLPAKLADDRHYPEDLLPDAPGDR